jgi:WD40 repeat protein
MHLNRLLLLLAGAAVLFPSLSAGKEPVSPQAEKATAKTDRYGDPLPPGAAARLGTVRFRHGGEVLCATFSADSKTLTSYGTDHVIRTWALPSRKELRCVSIRQAREPERAAAAALSPDGKLLALGFPDRNERNRFVLLCDAATGTVRSRLAVPGAALNVHSVAFSPDGKFLAAGDDSGNIDVWQVDSGKRVHRIDWNRSGDIGFAFSPDGRVLGTGSGGDALCLWDAATGKALYEIPGSGRGNAFFDGRLAFSPDDRLLATAHSDNTVRLWDVRMRKEIQCLGRRHEGVKAGGLLRWIKGLAFAPNSKSIAIASWDGVIHIREVATGKVLRRIDTRRKLFGDLGGATLTFSPDGKILASWGGEHDVRLWDVNTGEERNACEAHRQGVRSVAFAPDGRTLATGGNGMVLHLWDNTGKPLRSWTAAERLDTLGVAFSPDGKRVACAGEWPGVRRLEAADLSVLPSLKIEHRPAAVAFSPVGRILATADVLNLVSGAIHLCDEATGRELRQLNTDQGLCLAFSEDGALLASGGGFWTVREDREGSVHLWDPATGKKLHHLHLEGSMVRSVAFAAGGWAVASASEDGTLCLWETTTGQQRRRWSGGTCVAISPDGRLIAAGGDDNAVRVWDLDTGKLLARLRGHRGEVRAVAFSPDGRTLASGSEDTTALLWDVTRLPVELRRGEPLSARQLGVLWEDLRGSDGPVAYRAITALAAAPDLSVPFLRQRLLPVTADTARTHRLVADLGAAGLVRREAALAELECLGDVARPALRRCLTARPSLEQRLRVEMLLEKSPRTVVTAGGRQAVRAIEVLEQTATPEARRVLRGLADGSPQARLTQEAEAALRRLARRQVRAP